MFYKLSLNCREYKLTHTIGYYKNRLLGYCATGLSSQHMRSEGRRPGVKVTLSYTVKERQQNQKEALMSTYPECAHGVCHGCVVLAWVKSYNSDVCSLVWLAVREYQLAIILDSTAVLLCALSHAYPLVPPINCCFVLRRLSLCSLENTMKPRLAPDLWQWSCLGPSPSSDELTSMSCSVQLIWFL